MKKRQMEKFLREAIGTHVGVSADAHPAGVAVTVVLASGLARALANEYREHEHQLPRRARLLGDLVALRMVKALAVPELKLAPYPRVAHEE